VATGLVSPQRQASALSLMFTGLAIATLLGVPAGAWLGLQYGWRATFLAVAAIGVVATVVIAALVPADRGTQPQVDVRAELHTVTRLPVLLGLLMTVLGFGGLFAVHTYIQPLFTQVTRFSEAAVSPLLLLFGAGMIIGNLAGGRLADRGVARALVVTLSALVAAMVVMALSLHQRWPMACSAPPRSPPSHPCNCGSCGARPVRRAWPRASISAPSTLAMRLAPGWEAPHWRRGRHCPPCPGSARWRRSRRWPWPGWRSAATTATTP